MRKILSVVESAYRATIEEQDDTILWVNHAMKNSGADIAILLVRSAVNYAVRGHQPGRTVLGSSAEMRPPAVDQDLAKMVAAGMKVYLVEEDAGERGLNETEMIEGVMKIRRESLPELMSQYDQIWHW